MSTPKHLASLQSYWKRHKAFPSMAKLTEVLGLSSSGGVFKVLGKLTEAGYLERVDGGRIAPTSKFFERPVVGHARAGLPQPASQDVHDEHINVEDFLVERPDRTSFVHVRGDSMKNAGLLDGDLVVVEANSLPKPGDIVVAAIDGQVTVKYLRLDEANAWYLEPANKAYKPIHPRGSLEILGVVTGSFRRYAR